MRSCVNTPPCFAFKVSSQHLGQQFIQTSVQQDLRFLILIDSGQHFADILEVENHNELSRFAQRATGSSMRNFICPVPGDEKTDRAKSGGEEILLGRINLVLPNL